MDPSLLFVAVCLLAGCFVFLLLLVVVLISIRNNIWLLQVEFASLRSLITAVPDQNTPERDKFQTL